MEKQTLAPYAVGTALESDMPITKAGNIYTYTALFTDGPEDEEEEEEEEDEDDFDLDEPDEDDFTDEDEEEEEVTDEDKAGGDDAY
ncbi:hypothetical protein [Chitinophaga nivalis]|uniref:DNA primase n=1 Tax=Chitinophaga nivalis TaxID=2991709 RepID=A0ABT3IGC1_9BACT|nr:hypothetical protein [Chitinophaga nivalis]MCW3467322.1 hypothetical protein [Chitinophaga nivalis]MCW3482986.1 hypothetical protein [Chitinophaga nivalis]